MPQTRQAVKTILDNGLPCVVAITKADKLTEPEDARASISQKLFEMGMATEDSGGDVPVRLFGGWRRMRWSLSLVSVECGSLVAALWTRRWARC